jgi:hypothetical protein
VGFAARVSAYPAFAHPCEPGTTANACCHPFIAAGFGRIGRLVLRSTLGRPDVEVVAVNDPFVGARALLSRM